MSSRWLVQLKRATRQSGLSIPSCSWYICMALAVPHKSISQFRSLESSSPLSHPTSALPSICSSPVPHVTSTSYLNIALRGMFFFVWSSYDGIRPANPGDIPGIREIIAPLEEAG